MAKRKANFKNRPIKRKTWWDWVFYSGLSLVVVAALLIWWWSTLTSWVGNVASSAWELLGWGLFRLQPVARTLTIFLHGLSIIVRLLVTLARVVPSRQEGTPADVPLFVSSLLSIALSTAILYYVDKPDTQLLFEA